MAESKSLRVAYDEALVELGAKNDKVVVMDTDLVHMVMISISATKYLDRFFNLGIAEANIMCGAAGFVHSDFLPFISTLALFDVGRAYEQIRSSTGYVNANVEFGPSHSGLCAGEDGGSRQPIEDIVLMRVLPDMMIFIPCDMVEMKKAIFVAAGIDGPMYIRAACPTCDTPTREPNPLIPGKANVSRDDGDACVITAGLMILEALRAAELLEKNGVSATVVSMHIVKPIDSEIILTMAGRCGAIVTAEEHFTIGGPGSAVAEILAGKSAAEFARVGIQNRFGQFGRPIDLFKAYGLIAENVIETCGMILK